MKAIPYIVLSPVFALLVAFVLIQALLAKLGLMKLPEPVYGYQMPI